MKRPAALAEVTLVFALTLGVCRFLYMNPDTRIFSLPISVWILIPAIFIYVPLLIMIIRRQSSEAFGLCLGKRVAWRRELPLLTVIVLPIFMGAYIYYTKWLFGLKVLPGVPSDLARLLVTQFLCIALPEEVFYRGYVQSRLNEVFTGRIGGPLLTVGFGLVYANALFALGHYLITFSVHSLATFFPGLLFGWLRERSGSVLPSAIFHGLCNLTVISFQVV